MTGIVLIAALAGLVIGPLLRVAVDQIPPRRPLLRRHGPDDGSPLSPRALAPVVSWWAPDGPATTMPIGSPDDHVEGEREVVPAGWRAPLVDVATAIVFALLAVRFGADVQLVAYLVFGAALVVVTVIDIDHYRIPDRIVFPALGAGAVLLSVAAVVHDVLGALVGAAVGALAYFAFLFVFFVISPRGMGFGDVKLALVLGLHLGWAGAAREVDGVVVDAGLFDALGVVLFGALAGSVIGSVVGIGAIAMRGRRAHFPFGPSLCLGALVVVLCSEQILR